MRRSFNFKPNITLALRLAPVRTARSAPARSTMETNVSHNAILASKVNVPMNLVPIKLEEVIYRCVIGALAVAINTTVISTVSSCRQLYYPRHVYWGGISTVYLIYVTQPFMEVAAIYGKSQFACQAYVLLASVQHTAISVYLLLAACDRLIAIKCYEWYKKRITNLKVIVILIAVYATTFLTITSPYWLGYQRLSACAINLTHMYRIMLVNLTLAIISICLHVVIYSSSRTILRRYRKNLLSTPVKFTGVGRILAETRQSNTEEVASNSHTENSCRFLKRPNLSQLEAKAALSLSINVMPMWICHIPVALAAINLYWCLISSGNDCGLVIRVNAWLRNIYFAHSLYIPCVYAVTNNEFRRAVRHSISRRIVFSPVILP